MAARLAALLPRLVALTVIWLLGAATFTFAAGNRPLSATPAASPAEAKRKPVVIVVPDVRGKAYVFAKGILQDAGFAWRVRGTVQGYAANTVAVQLPSPGTRVVDNGEPTVALRLARNSAYGERGLPENESPYEGSRVLLPSEWRKLQAARERERQAEAEAAVTTTATTTTEPAPTTTEAAPTTTEAEPPPPEKTREPDFAVAGAPAEPTDEISLPERALRLERRLAAASKPTDRLVEHWLYQHAWVVTGARFGWHDGGRALRILIRVDEKLQARWGIGARSERGARAVLAYVEQQLK
jgi:hypothetical protein